MRDTKKLIDEIKAKLDLIEGHMVWLIKAHQRFSVGQRVEFSKRVIARRSIPKTRQQSRGKILAIDSSFTVRVKMDDRKHPVTYHHAFFNPVIGPKLF